MVRALIKTSQCCTTIESSVVHIIGVRQNQIMNGRPMECSIKTLSHGDTQQLQACFRVFSYLRPHLNESAFLSQVGKQQTEGYKIAYVEKNGRVVAASGYRIAHFLAWGRVLYVDDLVTDPEETCQGFGGAILNWLIEQAKHAGCDEIHLDTGYQRHDAHRLYLNKGFRLASHHMSLKF